MIDLYTIRKIAGIEEEGVDLSILDEAVEIPDDASEEHIGKMFNASKRALGIANKLKDPAQKKKHLGKVMSGMNKIRRHLKKMGAEEKSED